jgi:hypothetical protein
MGRGEVGVSFATGPYRTQGRQAAEPSAVRKVSSSKCRRSSKLSVGPSEVLFLMFFVMPLPVLAIVLAVAGWWGNR